MNTTPATKLSEVSRHPRVSEGSANILLTTLFYIEEHSSEYHSEFWGGGGRFNLEKRAVLPGATACLAGHVVLLFSPEKRLRIIRSYEIKAEAEQILGDRRELQKLFRISSTWPPHLLEHIDRTLPVPSLTVEGLRKAVLLYIETGKITDS
jgi:hypothetical protein